MKKLILIIFVLSTSSLWANCHQMNYVEPIVDTVDSCGEIIKKEMTKRGCEKETVKSVLYSLRVDGVNVKNGSSAYCVVETKYGIYQVMKSSMAEPPMASIIYSHWD